MNEIETALEDLDILVEVARQHMGIAQWLGIVPSALIIKESLEKQLNGGWILVKEKLPERTFEDCLITTEKGEIYTSQFYGYGEVFQGHKEYPEGVWQIDQYGETVIAWQPLPPVYVEVDNE